MPSIQLSMGCSDRWCDGEAKRLSRSARARCAAGRDADSRAPAPRRRVGSSAPERRSPMTIPDVSVTARFRSREVKFANGVRGRDLEIPSASPLNYQQAIARPAAMRAVTVDGKLFLPPPGTGGAPYPAIIVVAGSLGVADSHLRHAEAFTD